MVTKVSHDQLSCKYTLYLLFQQFDQLALTYTTFPECSQNFFYSNNQTGTTGEHFRKVLIHQKIELVILTFSEQWVSNIPKIATSPKGSPLVLRITTFPQRSQNVCESYFSKNQRRPFREGSVLAGLPKMFLDDCPLGCECKVASQLSSFPETSAHFMGV